MDTIIVPILVMGGTRKHHFVQARVISQLQAACPGNLTFPALLYPFPSCPTLFPKSIQYPRSLESLLL